METFKNYYSLTIPMLKTNKDEEISGKLNVVISLLNDIKHLEINSSMKEKIAYFSKFNLSDGDIAKILKISKKHVSKEKSLIKKQNGR